MGRGSDQSREMDWSPLKDILEKAGLSPNPQEIVFEGADFGKRPGIMKIFHLNEVYL